MRSFSTTLVLLLLLGGCSSSPLPSADAPASPSEAPVAPLVTSFTIDENNYSIVLKTVIKALNLEDIDAFRNDAASIAYSIEDGGQQLVANGTPRDGLSLGSISELDYQASGSPTQYLINYSCDSGGAAEQLLYDYGDAPFSQIDLSFEHCGYHTTNLSGRIRSTSGRRTDYEQTFDGFKRQTELEQLEVSGQRIDRYSWFQGVKKLSWIDASFRTDNDQLVLNSFNWHRIGHNSRLPDATTGFVTDLNGHTRYVREVSYNAELNASFNLRATQTNHTAVQVDAQLIFVGNFFAWDVPYGQAELPSYPVSDLGSPLLINANSNLNGEEILIDQVAKPERGQWQTGQIVITAEDGTSLTMRPSKDDPNQITIELNTSSTLVLEPVADGYQVYCPGVIDDCGEGDTTP